MLFSPNYPKPYSPEASCVWIVSVSEGHILALTFTDLDLEDDDSCHYDYVEVSSSYDPSVWKTIHIKCQDLSKNIYRMSSATILLGALRVKIYSEHCC